ncbi:MAG: hypothetical protein ACKV2T_26930 [Kofleriaceae bacterium]
MSAAPDVARGGPVMSRVLLVALLAAGCADFAGADESCRTSLQVTPSGDPVVGTEVRVTAIITNDVGGIPDIDWRVRFEQTDVVFSGQGSMEIAFVPDEEGTYSVDMTPSASGSSCPSAATGINVVPAQPGTDDVRLRIVPPLGVDVPPIDRVYILPTSPTYALGTVTLDQGRITDGTVGRQAYLRFLPDGQPDAVVEAYTDANGAYSARVQISPHHILVVPTDPAYPPQMLVDTSLVTGESYTLSTGVAITGVVRAPSGAALANAKVQVFQNDTTGVTIPSTIGTSASDGTFTVRAFTTTGTNPRVTVTPPAASGLPRLEGSSQGFNFANAITVNYGTSLITRNVSGTSVVRGGALANAKVTIVGTVPFTTAGTIIAGASAVAEGFVRIPVVANGSGVLPSALVPAADLHAVVEPANAPGDAAVVSFDTRTAVPGTITAPAMVPFSSTAVLAQTPLGGVRLELVPTGLLGMAGVGPTLLVASEAGVITGSVASGAIYKTYATDPSRRAGPAFGTVSSQTIATTLQNLFLTEALVISGSLKIQGQTNVIQGAGVQVLCYSNADCSGVERDRPFGEDASDEQGSFEVVVPRPGVPI